MHVNRLTWFTHQATFQCEVTRRRNMRTRSNATPRLRTEEQVVVVVVVVVVEVVVVNSRAI
jgi:hypothetical protein